MTSGIIGRDFPELKKLAEKKVINLKENENDFSRQENLDLNVNGL